MRCLGYKGSAWAKCEVCGGAKDVTQRRAAETGFTETMLREASIPKEFIPTNPKRIAQVDERGTGELERGEGRIKEGTGESK